MFPLKSFESSVAAIFRMYSVVVKPLARARSAKAAISRSRLPPLVVLSSRHALRLSMNSHLDRGFGASLIFASVSLNATSRTSILLCQLCPFLGRHSRDESVCAVPGRLENCGLSLA